jgi:nucleoid-associated protein YgaU
MNQQKGVTGMTADAKVGLLLGLVFIVLIAFLINGLPGFLSAPSKLEVLPDTQAPNVVLDKVAQDAVRAMNPPSLRESQPPKDTRTTVSIQEGKPEVQTPAPQPKPEDKPKEPVVVNNDPKTSKTPDPSLTDSKTPDNKTPDTKIVTPVVASRTYVVQPGDNLSKIAVAMYGAEVGNKLATVQAIYEANKDQMKTASDILPGKKLVIPNLAPATGTTTDSTQTSATDKPADKTSTKSTDKPATKPGGKTAKPKPANPDPGSFEQAKKKPVSQNDAGKTYRVKSGESLWTIAEKQLGDGNRYREIIALNATVLRKPDDVRGQMDLKLPKR